MMNSRCSRPIAHQRSPYDRSGSYPSASPPNPDAARRMTGVKRKYESPTQAKSPVANGYSVTSAASPYVAGEPYVSGQDVAPSYPYDIYRLSNPSLPGAAHSSTASVAAVYDSATSAQRLMGAHGGYSYGCLPDKIMNNPSAVSQMARDFSYSPYSGVNPYHYPLKTEPVSPEGRSEIGTSPEWTVLNMDTTLPGTLGGTLDISSQSSGATQSPEVSSTPATKRRRLSSSGSDSNGTSASPPSLKQSPEQSVPPGSAFLPDTNSSYTFLNSQSHSAYPSLTANAMYQNYYGNSLSYGMMPAPTVGQIHEVTGVDAMKQDTMGHELQPLTTAQAYS